MKKTLFSVALLAAATQALAFNEKQAVALTQKFLSTVACAYDESTFPVVKLDDDSYLVGWTGQLRCPESPRFPWRPVGLSQAMTTA